MADVPEKTSALMLRSVVTASAGAAAVFALDRWLFSRDDRPVFTAVEDLDRRINRLEDLALHRAKTQAQPEKSSPSETQIWDRLGAPEWDVED